MFWMGTGRSERKTGTAGADHFQSMGGNDFLSGLGGNDLLHGGRGNDTVLGGAGNDAISMLGADRLTGGAGKDFFSMIGIPYNQMLGSSIRSTITDFRTTGPAGQRDVLELSGFSFRWADRDADFTDGFSMRRVGSDVLIRTRDAGGNVQEVLLKNVALAQLTQGNVKIIPSPFTLGTERGEAAPGITWTGTDRSETRRGGANDDFLIGGGGNDTLIGNRGDDTLNGQTGRDLLQGGAGADRIYLSGGDRAIGGAAGDTFVLLSHAEFPDITNAGNAVITDFDAIGPVHDRLDLSEFDLRYAARDLGLEDRFELRSVAAGVRLSVIDAEGDRFSVVLQGVALRDLNAADFIF